jgi:glycosyltransferase involved in cell wall biosynthesis
VRLLFDMRGFWADERVEGGLWDLGNPLFRSIFNYFKRREAELLATSDAVVSLTDNGKKVLLDRADRTAAAAGIAVIPCCVDFGAFPLTSAESRHAGRALLGIDAGARVAAYLGSIGTWYMLDEMLDCFAVELERDAEAIMLFVSRDDPDLIRTAAAARGIGPASLVIRAASRDEVPRLLAAADYGLFFIRPTFSKIASCPTKLGEFLAMGLPVVTNGGVGDVADIVRQSGAGVLIERFDRCAYRAALDQLDLLAQRGDEWRERARQWFDLDSGVASYDLLYRTSPSDLKTSISRGACDARE